MQSGIETSVLKGRTIVLAVTAGIAAYKSAVIIRELKEAYAEVLVIMTRRATEFITPLTLETLSRNPVAVEMFDRENEWSIEHVALADSADILIVAPATANIIGKTASGIADDLVSTTILTMMSKVPIIMAPAMNNRMWENPVVQRNVKFLENASVHFVGPTEGKLADGRFGMGRMAEVDDIINTAKKILQR